VFRIVSTAAWNPANSSSGEVTLPSTYTNLVDTIRHIETLLSIIESVHVALGILDGRPLIGSVFKSGNPLRSGFFPDCVSTSTLLSAASQCTTRTKICFEALITYSTAKVPNLQLACSYAVPAYATAKLVDTIHAQTDSFNMPNFLTI
jgi:hypothetical protein